MRRAADTDRRRRIVDPRLLIGVGLVIASVAGVVGLVAALDTRSVVVAAAATLVPGDRVQRGDLVERSVFLDGADALYLTAGDVPDDGLVIVQGVRTGELLPRSSVGDTEGVSSTALVVETSGPVGSGVRPGAAVELWASAVDPDTGGYGAPAVLVQDAVVTRVLDDDGLVSSGSGGAVEVLVPRDRVALILQAQADGDVLAVVPAGLPLGE